jgi:hypothetical protein
VFSFTSRNDQHEARWFLLRFVNERSYAGGGTPEDRRFETRTNLNVVVWIVPCDGDCPDMAQAFTAVTKDFGSAGIGVIANQPIAARQVLLRLPSEPEARFVRANVSSCSPMEAGWFLFGMEATELIDPQQYPQLEQLDEAVVL